MEEKKKALIIFDTDIGGDCDDAGALAMTHRLCDMGEAELLAVTGCYESPYVAGCIDAINTYYNRKVPVGVNYGTDAYPDTYTSGICNEFPSDYPAEKYNAGHKPEDAVRLIRRTLAAAEDKSISLVATGPLSTLGRLIKSGADDVSSLTGAELVEKKVLRTVIMGGRFSGTWPMPVMTGDPNYEGEYNIRADIPAAQAVCDMWPGELVFSSFEIGMWTVTMREYTAKAPKDDPVRRAYEIFEAIPGNNAKGRQSWDHTAMLHAIRPDAGYYSLHPYGRISVTGEGITEWHADENARHTYLIPSVDYCDIERVIDSLVLPE